MVKRKRLFYLNKMKNHTRLLNFHLMSKYFRIVFLFNIHMKYIILRILVKTTCSEGDEYQKQAQSIRTK